MLSRDNEKCCRYGEMLVCIMEGIVSAAIALSNNLNITVSSVSYVTSIIMVKLIGR